MAAIDIPDAYWTIPPRPFTALIGRFAPAMDAIGVDVTTGAAAVVNGNDLAVRNALALADGDRAVIVADAAGEVTALATTPTGQAIAATVTGDALADGADTSAAASGQYVSQPVVIPPPPDGSIDNPLPPVPDQPGGETPSVPGAPPPPPPQPPAGNSDSVLRAQITALYDTLLGREPDEGGLANWEYEVAVNGHTIDWVQMQIMASREYQNRVAPPPPAPDLNGFVTHEQLAAVVDGLDLTVNLWV